MPGKKRKGVMLRYVVGFLARHKPLLHASPTAGCWALDHTPLDASPIGTSLTVLPTDPPDL